MLIPLSEVLVIIEQFFYLRTIISKNGGSDRDIVCRISKALQTFGCLPNGLQPYTYFKYNKSNLIALEKYPCRTKLQQIHEKRVRIIRNKF